MSKSFELTHLCKDWKGWDQFSTVGFYFYEVTLTPEQLALVGFEPEALFVDYDKNTVTYETYGEVGEVDKSVEFTISDITLSKV